MERLTYSVREVAGMLGVCIRTVRNHIKSGDIKAIELGGRVLITRDELDRVLGMDQKGTNDGR